MSVDRNSKSVTLAATRPKASNYDMFEGLQQTRRKTTEAKLKRPVDTPAKSPVVEK